MCTISPVNRAYTVLINEDRGYRIAIMTRYGLDGRGIRFSLLHNLPDRPCGPQSLLYIGYWGSLLGVKMSGRGVDVPHASSAEGDNE